MTTGVYLIKNVVTGKVYVGSSIRNLNHRILQHKSSLKRGIHENELLQRSWNKYGEQNFEFSVLQVCEKGKVLEAEQSWIDRYQSADRSFGYNIAPIAGNCSGVKHSEEARKRMSDAKKGRPALNKGVSPNEETKAKMGAAKKKYFATDEGKQAFAKMLAASKTPEAIEKMRKSIHGKRLGRKRPDARTPSPEVIARMKELREQRLTYKAISEMFGVNVATAHKYVNT